MPFQAAECQTVGVTANPAERCDVYIPAVDFIQACFQNTKQKSQLQQVQFVPISQKSPEAVVWVFPAEYCQNLKQPPWPAFSSSWEVLMLNHFLPEVSANHIGVQILLYRCKQTL